MSVHVREARPEDRRGLAAFATDTFEWGDYVLDAFDDWLADDMGAVHVAVDDDDVAVAIARATLLSPTEAWLQGTRVHPAWRRRGIGTVVGNSLLGWVRQRGGLVARLAVEDWNDAARAQVEAVGLRRVASFARAHRTTGEVPADRGGNGGRRARSRIRLRPAHTTEAEPAYVSWSTSQLCREVRGLFAIGWTWRRLTYDDLTAAAGHHALWEGGADRAMAATNGDVLEAGWCDTSPSGAADLARALVDLADNEGAARVQAMVPATAWLRDAFSGAGYELDRISVYAKGL